MEKRTKPNQEKKNSLPREPYDDRLRLHAVVHHEPRPLRRSQQGLVEPQGAEGGDLRGEDDAQRRERWRHRSPLIKLWRVEFSRIAE